MPKKASHARARQDNLRHATEIGTYLAKTAVAGVIWPTDVELPEALTEVYPRTLPPLRTDRDTLLVGTGSVSASSGPLKVGVTAQAGDQSLELNWTVRADLQQRPRLPNGNGRRRTARRRAQPPHGRHCRFAGGTASVDQCQRRY